MVRHNIDLYKDQNVDVDCILSRENIKRTRFFRECVEYVLADPKHTEIVISNCKTVNYRKD